LKDVSPSEIFLIFTMYRLRARWCFINVTSLCFGHRRPNFWNRDKSAFFFAVFFDEKYCLCLPTLFLRASFGSSKRIVYACDVQLNVLYITFPNLKIKKLSFFLCYFYKRNMHCACHFCEPRAIWGERNSRNGQGFGQYVAGSFIVTNIAMIVVSNFSFKRNIKSVRWF
jgi:hypothetical protein